MAGPVAGRHEIEPRQRAPEQPVELGQRVVEWAEDAEAYAAYLEETGLAEYRATPGNRGVLALRRVVEGRAEFLLISFWESEEAIRRFAGDSIERAVFYPEDDRFLIDRDLHVHHHEVFFRASDGADAGPGA
ncbi:MAG TPA: antibiotic biosynthesis monooxygenase [Longimicrobiales bacterium]